MHYNSTNLFAKILRGEIPCQKIAEDTFGLAFYDIAPKAPVHVLVIPKNSYCNSCDFFAYATDQEISGFYRFVNQVIAQLDIKQTGFRLISNYGDNGGQQIEHFHIHILAGKPLGSMVENC